VKRYVEYRWILEGFTPDTIPMRRLAEYMLQVSKLFGSEEKIRFERVENNCVALVNKVPAAHSGKIQSRIRAIGRGEGSFDAKSANSRINQMLYEDEASARIKTNGAIILRFPGNVIPEAADASMSGPASLTGYFYSLSENQKGEVKAKLRIVSSDNKSRTVDAVCDSALADNVKALLFNHVRVTGVAEWFRTDKGEWRAENIKVNNATKINTANLQTAVQNIRSANVKWSKDPLKFQNELEADDKDK